MITDGKAAAVGLAAVGYVVLAVVWAADFLTRPRPGDTAARGMTTAEFDAYSRFHTYVRAPGAGQLLSALLNAQRLTCAIAGVYLFAKGWWIGGIAGCALFLLSGGLIARLNPTLYLGAGVREGNKIATELLDAMQRATQKRTAALSTSVDQHDGKELASWLFSQVMDTAQKFLDEAERNRWQGTLRLPFMGPESEAVYLGYKLVGAAYRNTRGPGTDDAWPVVRMGVFGYLVKAVDRDFQKMAKQVSKDFGKSPDLSVPPEVRKAAGEAAQARLSEADKAIGAINSSALQPSLAGLSAFFGGANDPVALQARFGATVRQLYDGARKIIAAKLAEPMLKALTLPLGTELLDVETIPVALLPDGTAVAFDPERRPFNSASAFSKGSPVSPPEFAELIEDSRRRKSVRSGASAS